MEIKWLYLSLHHFLRQCLPVRTTVRGKHFVLCDGVCVREKFAILLEFKCNQR